MIPAKEALGEEPKRPRRVMLVVGEASGDVHGAGLVRCLHQQDPTLEVFGVAGDNLKREGLRDLINVNHLTGMGLAEVWDNLGALWRGYRLLRRALRDERPDLLILIDFPELNLRLARLAKQLRIPVLYYISPQVWAWRRYRTRRVASCVDHMAVVFPFEVSLYEREGVQVSFVGHPLLDVVRPDRPREATLVQHGLDPSRQTIAMLPGSRVREVAYLLPPMLEAAQQLSQEVKVQFVLVRASTVQRKQMESLVSMTSVPVSIVDGDVYNVLSASDLAWVASGTATLEAALLHKPMIVVYRLAWLTYVLARMLVHVQHIGMVNILAGERVVPELIQGDVTGEKILRETRRILTDHHLRQKMIQKLIEVRERLGAPGAPSRVADLALALMT